MDLTSLQDMKPAKWHYYRPVPRLTQGACVQDIPGQPAAPESCPSVLTPGAQLFCYCNPGEPVECWSLGPS